MKKKVYFDLDGVLADWEAGLKKETGLSLVQFNKLPKEKQDELKDGFVAYRYFANLPVMKEGLKTFEVYLKSGVPIEINSAYGDFKSDEVKRAKYDWVQRNIVPIYNKYRQDELKINLVRKSRDKWGAVNPDSADVHYLIDDREKSVRYWEQQGGKKAKGILFKG